MADILGRTGATAFDQRYVDTLADLSDGSVHRRFDPYLDIDWDSPELRPTR